MLHRLTLCFVIYISSLAAHAEGISSLFPAADKGDVAKIRQALKTGANVNAKDGDGWTPLMLAASNGKLEAVKTLVAAGADIQARSSKGETPLMAAVASDNAALVKFLLDKGADPMTKTTAGLTALSFALGTQNKPVIDSLSKAEVKVEKAAQAEARSKAKKEDEAKSRALQLLTATTDAATQAFQAGDFPRAAGLFKEVVALSPNNALAWHFLGQSLTKAGDLYGARKAYRKTLELAPPDGDVAKRTQHFFSKLPLTEPGKVVLPSGQTLLDTMNKIGVRSQSENKVALLTEIAALLVEYGAYPQLLDLQQQLLIAAINNFRIDDTEIAKAALPDLQKLRAMFPKNLNLLKQEALTLHKLGLLDQAKEHYQHWLEAGGTEERLYVSENLNRLKRGESVLVRVNRALPASLPSSVKEAMTVFPLFTSLPDSPSLQCKETSKNYILHPSRDGTDNFGPGQGGIVRRTSWWEQTSTASEVNWNGLLTLGGLFALENSSGHRITSIENATGEFFPLRTGNKFNVIHLNAKNERYRFSCEVMNPVDVSEIQPTLKDGRFFRVACDGQDNYSLCSDALGLCPFQWNKALGEVPPDFAGGYRPAESEFNGRFGKSKTCSR